jgi:hypothetical protein
MDDRKLYYKFCLLLAIGVLVAVFLVRDFVLILAPMSRCTPRTPQSPSAAPAAPPRPGGRRRAGKPAWRRPGRPDEARPAPAAPRPAPALTVSPD